jgi:hypothetical protein
VNQVNADLLAKRRDEIATEASPVIEEQGLGDRLILPHGRNDCPHDVDLIGLSEEAAIE